MGHRFVEWRLEVGHEGALSLRFLQGQVAMLPTQLAKDGAPTVLVITAVAI